jgi:benzoyl-CoA reductase/2-hydroxyglutaryl-CoA dehydratase subunit BcrC/BadD/HgdB
MQNIGITTTIPVEIIFAAGKVPVDLNNIFINHPAPGNYVDEAELKGFPRTVCGWIKGLYTTALKIPNLEAIVAVTQGDCSNTHALMETWQSEGIKIIPFAYPYDRDIDLLAMQMQKMAHALGVSWDKVIDEKLKLDKVRALVWEIDHLTWRENIVSGLENHIWQVSCSDFNGDPQLFVTQAQAFLQEVKTRNPFSNNEIRLGFMGVPPIFTDFYPYIEEQGARIVFNEVQRQFTVPFPGKDITEAYQQYTYPYSVFERIADIKKEIAQRKLQGIIHYTQSFCFRQIEDIIIRKELGIPVLTIEGDRPGPLDARTKMRIEAFLEVLR